jgi:hypothetical protein
MRIQRRVQQPTFASTQSPTHVPFTERIITNEHGAVTQKTVIFAGDSLQITIHRSVMLPVILGLRPYHRDAQWLDRQN